MNKHDRIEDCMIGRIAPSSPMYEEYNRDLSAVEREQFAKWIHIEPT
jgi:hypothetical protein